MIEQTARRRLEMTLIRVVSDNFMMSSLAIGLVFFGRKHRKRARHSSIRTVNYAFFNLSAGKKLRSDHVITENREILFMSIQRAQNGHLVRIYPSTLEGETSPDYYVGTGFKFPLQH